MQCFPIMFHFCLCILSRTLDSLPLVTQKGRDIYRSAESKSLKNRSVFVCSGDVFPSRAVADVSEKSQKVIYYPERFAHFFFKYD